MDSILRPLGAIISAILNLWGWSARGAERHALLLVVIPRVLGDQGLTIPQLSRRAAADRLWLYGEVPHIALARALDELVAAGRVVGPLDEDEGGRYMPSSTAKLSQSNENAGSEAR